MDDWKKTLFVTDLDGTLLRSDGSLSVFARDTVNACTAAGMHLAFATARSLYTAMKVIGEVESELPMILHNGAFIQTRSGEYLLKNLFQPEDVSFIRRTLETMKIPPIVYAIQGGREWFRYNRRELTPEGERFLATRQGDPRDCPQSDNAALYDGEVFYLSCLGKKETLLPAYDALGERFSRIFQPDYYNGDYWLELLPKGATKAGAALRLKELLGCTQIVAFGDALNDLPLFKAADACYAVGNAVPALKAAATGILASNDSDGVADFLRSILA